LPVNAASAHEIYAKAGFPGAGAGYGHSLNERFGVRADFSSTGTLHHHGVVVRKSRWDADVKADHLGTYADSGSGTITIRGIKIPYGRSGDAVHVRTRWPKLAPYLGIGWGHHAGQRKGLGIIADLGISFGSPQTELTISAPLRQRLHFLAKLMKTSVDAELEHQRRDLAAEVATLKVIPHLFVGVSYRF